MLYLMIIFELSLSLAADHCDLHDDVDDEDDDDLHWICPLSEHN